MELQNCQKRSDAMKSNEKLDELYCCYSLNLRRYLTDNGIEYKLAALNPNSKKMFWVYIKNEELDKALSNWKIK